MSQTRLKYVRENSKHIILTQHPDKIHPRVLSEALVAIYGEKQFTIALRRGIYVIYINKAAVDEQSGHLHNAEDTETNAIEHDKAYYLQQLDDTKAAQKVLSEV
ncbi:hypothetical protein F5B20DRAFT_580110 [Whalleya microplaca]|nr:hypothetical protein F5B20DRAFT_580110 [Whalleya microplaca]